MKRALITLALVAAMLLVFSSCISVRPGYFEVDQKTAELAVDRFHAQLSDEKYEEIYLQTADVFRQTAQKSDLILAMKQTHDKYGAFVESEQSGANVIMGAPREVRLVYNTKYAKGDATEQFIWLVDGNEAKLAMYRCHPAPVRPTTDK